MRVELSGSDWRPERREGQIRVEADGELRPHLSTGAHLQPVSRLQSPPPFSFLLPGVGRQASGAAQPFSNQTPQGWRHACDLVQSGPLEGGNAKFPPAPVARVAASCCFFFPLLPGSGYRNHLANDQQVGRCPFPLRGPTHRKGQSIRASSRHPISGGSPASRQGRGARPRMNGLLT